MLSEAQKRLKTKKEKKGKKIGVLLEFAEKRTYLVESGRPLCQEGQ